MPAIIFMAATALIFVVGCFAATRIIAGVEARKKLESEKSRKDEICAQLIQASRLACVGELAAGLSHEIGNLLQTILGNTELMMQSGSTEDLPAIKESALAAKKILSNLMDFARQQKMSFCSGDVRDVLETTLKIYARQLEFQNIKIMRDYDAVPDLRISESALQQVFLNAILNAQRAMPKGGKLFIAILRNDPWVSIIFRDTGVGIKKENMSELFKPFFTTWHDGHGLGLGVSSGIIKQHGGEISVSSEGEGRGAEVRIKLPLVFKEPVGDA
ncbi:MAG: ATP-binding protein [Endomicrobiia bacterium]|nr:ATP-binding protein [Endomicrobiia bacterium]